MTGEVRVVFIVVPLPHSSASAMANLPLPPVRFPRPPGSLPTQAQLPPLWVTVQPAGGKVALSNVSYTPVTSST